MTPTSAQLSSKLALLLFFGWNTLFLCVMGAGFVPAVWLGLMQDSLEGLVPLDFVLFSNLALLIPVGATLLGLRLWRSPWRITRLFYCVELPLFMLCLYRLFGIHELTLPSAMLFGFIGLGALAQLVSLLRVAPPEGAWRYLDLALRTLSLLAALYTGLLASFWVLPTLFVVFEVIGRAYFWIVPLGFFASSGLVLCLWPVVSVLASARGYWSSVRLLQRSRSRGGLRAMLVTSAVVGLVALVFASLPAQPQAQVRASLALDAPQDDGARRHLLENEALVRAAFLNAYLSKYRYVSDRRTDRGGVRSAYWHTVGLSLEHAETIQGWWNTLINPLLYDGDQTEDRAWAMGRYAELFDQPIEKAERPAILRALSATFRREDREAGLLDVDRRRVRLVRQAIEIRPEQSHAEVEIYEVYENQTYDQEEISYHFSLPETAVITGLWLGESERIEERYRFVVAPRGAAQAVYKAEVQRRVDPALLEQVGPRQYRLRAFPIPPKTHRSLEPRPQPRMHLWLTYRTLPVDGTWPLPALAEKRNVYFDRQSERSLNGAAWTSNESWMPESPRAHGVAEEAEPSEVRVALGSGTVMSIRSLERRSELQPLPGRSLVLVDRSYSMRGHAAALAQAVGELESAASGAGANHYLLGPTHGRPDAEAVTHVDVRELSFFGAGRASELLAAAAAGLDGVGYERVFVLTDEGSYELESDHAPKRDLGVPVYWVHLGGRFPEAYDDTTLETIQRRGGGAVGSVAEALVRIQVEAEAKAGFVSTADGLVFELVPAHGTEVASPLSALAARQLVSGALRTGQAQGLEQLDRMHAVAKRFEIVTPYSSMLVLVEDRQRKALEAAERSDDRFDRELEHGAEHGEPNITGTPEPEEWALFFVGLILAYFAARRRAAGSALARPAPAFL